MSPKMELSHLTFREVADREHIPMVCQVRQCHVRRPLTDHQVDSDKALEHDGPGRIAQAILKRAEDLSNPMFT